MGFRKYRADKLFDGYHLYNENKVLITQEDGVIEAVVEQSEAGEDIVTLDGILCPGFINCHCHLELSHMKGQIPRSTGLIDFVLAVVTQRHAPDSEIIVAIGEAEEEMLVNGIVAVGDICNNNLTINQKQKGRLYYHNFIEASGFNPQIAATRFQRSVDFFREYAKNYSIPVESNSIVPHAPYSVTHELWKLILEFPGNHLLTIHNQEFAAENEWFSEKKGMLKELYVAMGIESQFFQPSGKTSLQTYLPWLIRNQSMIFVHNLATTREDILAVEQSREHGQRFWCLCPNANEYISGALPDVDLLRQHAVDIVLGTDSLASNDQLSILSEMRMLQQKFPRLETSTLLGWATRNGARALEMESLLGSFGKAKKPGILLVNEELTSVKRLA